MVVRGGSHYEHAALLEASHGLPASRCVLPAPLQVLDILGRHWEANMARHPPYVRPSPLTGVTKAEQAALAAPTVAAARAAKVWASALAEERGSPMRRQGRMIRVGVALFEGRRWVGR